MAVPKQENLDVVIVGGSLAGLCVGVALKSLSQIRNITILERYQSNQLQDQGAGIRVGDEVAAFLQRYANVIMNDYGLPLNIVTVINTEGAILMRRDLVGNCATTWAQLFRVMMLAFLDVGGDESTTCKYRYSCNVRDVVEQDKNMEVHLINEDDKQETFVADLVIGADGASSRVREIMLPEVKRTYAGYVLLRGLVPVEDLSDETWEVTDASGTFCFTRESQVLSYTVPGNKTGPPDSHELLNWGWYQKRTEEELAGVMTGVTGKRYAIALPQGEMREEVANEIRARAQQELPPQFAETVAKTMAPFVQVVTDVEASQNRFCDGKVLLVGDSAAGQRPHTASAVTQACFQAHLLRLHLQGLVSADQWCQETRLVSSTLVKAGQELGPINLSTSNDPSEKAKLHFGKIAPVQKLLAAKWAAFFREDGLAA